ncbi:MAG: O-antigen ligase family protein [Thermaurantimonas sp.]|uniref:O-antigen ligase family protein n=1 Tax=Thermaurantimonas sp. TaxID=2681568 RepID=UPI00391D21CB
MHSTTKNSIERKANPGSFSFLIWTAFSTGLFILYFDKVLPDPAQLPRQIAIGIMTTILGIYFYQKFKNQTFNIHYAGIALIGWWITMAFLIPKALVEVDARVEFLRHGLSVAYFIVMVNLFKTTSLDERHLSTLYISSALIISMVALFQILLLLKKEDFFMQMYSVQSVIGHKNLVSGALLITLPWMYYIFRYSELNNRVFGLAGFWSSLIVIGLLRTRAAWVGLFLALLILAPNALRWMRSSRQIELNYKRILPFTLAAITLIGSIYISRHQIIDPTNLNHRIKFWKNSIEMFKENPFGVGAGNWQFWFPKYGVEGMNTSVMDGETVLPQPHNDFLWVLTESGIVGFLFFIAFWVLVLFTAYSIYKSSADDLLKRQMLIALLSMVAYLGFSFFDFPLERPEIQLLVLTTAAFVVSKSTKGFIKLPAWSAFVFVGVALSSSYSGYQKLKSEKISVKVLEANARQDARRIIPLAESALSNYFVVDRVGNTMYYYMGLGYMAQQNWPKMKEMFDKALELTPYHFISMNQMGNFYKAQNDLLMAREWYIKALKIAPRYTAALLNKSEVEHKLGYHNDALNTLNLVYEPKWEMPQYQAKIHKIIKYSLRAIAASGDYPRGLIPFFQNTPPSILENDQLLVQHYIDFLKQRKAQLQKQNLHPTH